VVEDHEVTITGKCNLCAKQKKETTART
jgi:hypothetical protein